ncbi:unnamed protein product [Laminaria digitata]
MTECADDVPSTISPNDNNFFANEYNDADCTEPTGNTGVLSAGHVVGGVYAGECVQTLAGRMYTTGECRADGSYILQFFSPEDDTCSGEVWTQPTGPTEYSPPLCSGFPVDGLYYGYTSCTTDAATIGIGFTAPTTPPIPVIPAIPITPPIPSIPSIPAIPAIPSIPTIEPTEVEIDAAAATPAPSTDVDDPDAANTPAPMTNVNDSSAAADTPTPADNVGVTTPPAAAVAESGEVEETTSPITSDEEDVALASGTARTGNNGVAVGTMVFACAVGLLVPIAM